MFTLSEFQVLCGNIIKTDITVGQRILLSICMSRKFWVSASAYVRVTYLKFLKGAAYPTNVPYIIINKSVYSLPLLLIILSPVSHWGKSPVSSEQILHHLWKVPMTSITTMLKTVNCFAADPLKQKEWINKSFDLTVSAELLINIM